MGNPEMPWVDPGLGQSAQQLRSLPGAEREARAVGEVLGTAPLLGKEATKSTALRRMPASRVIHLATHGLLEDIDSSGVPGAIALAPSDADEGLLSAREILGLSLRADLVVLSACNTGRGKTTGDGVVGLSRSLLAAGACSVVASLWSVEDESTAFLMEEFYDRFTIGTGKAEALRQAMLRTRDRYRDPAQWAAFTLIGEGH
jgi:CHAT domain-containing protein